MRGAAPPAASRARGWRWPTSARARRQGDRAAQPARLVELPLLPGVRAGVDVPQLRGRARAASRRRVRSPAITAGTASAVPERCGACGSAALARHGAGTERLEHELRAALGGDELPDLPARRRRRGAARTAPAVTLARVRGRARRRARRHADGRQGPRLPRRHARRRARRRPDAAVPGLPRRGADVRAVTQLAGRAGRGDAGGGRCSCRRSRPTRARSRTPRATTPTAFLGRGARPPRGARLPAVRVADPDRLLGARRPAERDVGRRARCARGSRRRARPCSGPRRCSGCAAAPRSQLVVKATDRAAGDRGGRARPSTASRRPPSRRQVSVSVDVDPQ